MTLRTRLLAMVWLLAAPAASAAEPPAYLLEALTRFSSDAPRGWAYTLTTTRGDEVSVERYDPSRPKGGEWTLLRRNGREPTAAELQRYVRYKASNAPATARATFEKGDINLGSLQRGEEDETHAEFHGRFREDVSEPLLPHLVVSLRVNKTIPAVERTVIRLAGVFTPALGVRMRQLEVTMEFSPPEPGRPALPRTAVSRFRGRLFFLVPLEEDLRIEYSEFTPVVPAR